MRILLSKKGADSPLYLKLACEEIRLFGVYEKVSDYLHLMSQTTPLLIEFVLNRIEGNYGQDLVRDIFMMLHHSRQGLLCFVTTPTTCMLRICYEFLSRIASSVLRVNCYQRRSCAGGPIAFNSPICTRESFTQHPPTGQPPLWFIGIALYNEY